MRIIKIVNEQLYNKCVISSEIEKMTGNECDLFLELTPEGLQILFPENWEKRPASFNITGEFGRYDYTELGFEIV